MKTLNWFKTASVTALLALLIVPAVTPNVSAQFNPVEESCDQLSDEQRATSTICQEADNVGAEDDLTGTEGVIQRVANLIAIVGGIIAVIIIVVAGIQMTLSQGDPQKVKNSRNAIIYAAVGIGVIVVARSIIILIINRT